MDASGLIQSFNYDHFVIEQNLLGVGQAESLKGPPAGGNCVNWVLGHIVASRNRIHALVGLEPAIAADRAARYARGSEPITDPARATSIETVLDDLGRSQKHLLKRLERIAAAELAKEADGSTVFLQLHALQFHEAYHAGQLGILRRFLGTEGAVR